MSKRTIILAVCAFAFGLFAAVALAGNGRHIRSCTIHGKNVCPPPFLPSTYIDHPTTAVTSPLPPPPTTTVSLPPIEPRLPVEAFCAQTKERGETFIQANKDAFKPGGSWYGIWRNEQTVVVAGHPVTLQWEDGKGVILAANVPGVGLTCDQPYVSTNGVYADPAYGNR